MSDIPEQNAKPIESAESSGDTGGIDVSNLGLGGELSFTRVTVEEERKEGKRRAPEEDTVVGATKEGLYSAAYSLVSTGKGALQLIDKPTGWNTQDILPEMDFPAEAEFGSTRWYGQQVGGALGILGPFALTHQGVKSMAKPLARSGMGQKMSQSWLLNKQWKSAALEFGAAGAVFDFVGREVQPGQNFWETRVKNAGVGFATFSTLGASSVALAQVGRPAVSSISNSALRKTATIGNDLMVAGGSGVPAGAMHALSHDYLHKGKLASWENIQKDAFTFAVVGIGLGVKDVGMRELGIQNKSFLDHANEAAMNQRLNDNLLTNARKAPPARETAGEAGQLTAALSNLGIKQTRVETAESVGTKPTLLETAMANITGKGRETVLENRVLAQGENAGKEIRVDVAPEHQNAFHRGMELVDKAVTSKTEADKAQLVEFLNAEGAPVRQNMYEAAHLFSDAPMIRMLDGLFKISPNQSGVHRGEILAKGASRENAPQEVIDAFTRYANNDGVNMGHHLIEYGMRTGNQAIIDIAVNTYRAVEASPVAKQIKMVESVGELTTRSQEAYKAEGAEIELVKIATETVADRLTRQIDPTQSKPPEVFEYGKMNERMQEFERGLDILNQAKREGKEVDAAQLSEFAAGDGAKVGRALLEWAHLVDNPTMVRQIERAYGMEANGMSGTILGEALAKAAARPDAPQSIKDRFDAYAGGNGEAVGFYLLDKAAELGNPGMEFAVVSAYAKNLDSPLGAILNKGGQLVNRASGLESAKVEQGGKEFIDAPKQEMMDLINFAMTDGQGLGRALEYGAKMAENPRAQTVIREAYLVAQGKNVRDTGDAKIQIPEFIARTKDGDVPFPTEKLGEFFEIFAKDLPTTVEGYANLRVEIMEHLAKNPELSAKINNELSKYNGMTVGEIIAAETQHSMIAGPIDFYFKSNHGLSKFEATAAKEPTLYTEPTIGGENAARVPEYFVARKFVELETAKGEAKQDVAAELVGDIGNMTPGQFRQWIEFLNQKSEARPEMTNLTDMAIPKTDVLGREAVKDALKSDTTGDGVLNSYRQILSDRSGQTTEVIPSWVNRFVGRRLRSAQRTQGEGTTALQLLENAMPKWLLNKIGKGVQFPEGGMPKYDPTIQAELVTVLDAAARADRPGLERLLHDTTGSRFAERPSKDSMGERLDVLEQVLSVKDADLAGSLLRLGSENPQAMRKVLGKLNTEKSAPEYTELIKLVLPKAETITDVSLLLDTMMVGNRAKQAGRQSKRNPKPEDTAAEVQSYHELAMNALNVLVEPGTAGHARANKIVEGIIEGTIRDPFVPRDGKPGGGRFGNRGGQGRSFDRGGNRDRKSKEGGD